MKEFVKGPVLATGLLTIGILVCFAGGCSSPAVSEPKYPEYDKWWTEVPGPCKSTNLSDLGQGDILVFSDGREAVLL